jgi:diguanylate cyclase (GGDEF)-like protein/PAS domain S-box-containing protein
MRPVAEGARHGGSSSFRPATEREGSAMTRGDAARAEALHSRLLEAEARIRLMEEHLDQVFWIMSADGMTFTYISPLIEAIWGLSVAELHARPASWLDPIHEGDRAAARRFFDDFDRELTREAAFRINGADGRLRWIQVKRSPVRDEKGAIVGLAGSARDITEERRREDALTRLAAELEDKAQRDALTGLANRRGLDEMLARELERAQRSGGALAAVLVDADDFKRVNDTLGHATGDIVLQDMARRMVDVLRPTDCLARVGGDEFLAILPETRLAEAVKVAERLRLAIAAHPVHVGGEGIEATASLGVGLVSSRAPSIKEILDATRMALKQSKFRGKNRVVAATDAEGKSCVVPERSDSFAEFSDHRVFETHCQDIHDLKEGVVVGHELFSRGPDGPYRQPGDFFRLSHENNALPLVDLRCLESCVDSAQRIGGDLPIHLNLFPSTLLETLPSRLIDILGGAGAVSRYCLELSEQQLLGAPSYLVDHIASLRAAGLRLALDDVGYGRSSLEALVILEPDVVKIARECIQGVDLDRRRRGSLSRLLKAMTALTSGIIAEGVETEGEAAVLGDLGVTMAQGFLWDRPRKI